MIASISIIFKIGLQEIGEEKNFENNEHDEEFDQNDQPNLLTPAGKV